MPLRAVSFASSNSSIAAVDSLGVVSPLQTGKVTVSASAGGWRSTSILLTIVGNAVDTLLDETWRTGISSGWVPYGEPVPAVDTGPSGIAALNNRGDGRFSSGVHSAWRYDARNGLALDALLSTPLSLRQWQVQLVNFDFGYDSAGLAGWDHRSGEPWLAQGSHGDHHLCGFEYPWGPEGPGFGDSIQLVLGAEKNEKVRWRAPRMLAGGGWYRLRIQVFPDGRCGVGLNGTALAVSGPHEIPAFAHVFLHGLSYHTKMLVGPLTIRTGVPTDIDWSRIGNTAELRPLTQSTPSTRVQRATGNPPSR